MDILNEDKENINPINSGIIILLFISKLYILLLIKKMKLIKINIFLIVLEKNELKE